MHEDIPNDLGTGIPPINGISMLEAIRIGKELEIMGIKIDDLVPGQILNYLAGQDRYSIEIRDKRQSSNEDGEERTEVTVSRVSESGDTIESATGLFYGVSISGDGNMPMPILPPEGEWFLPVVLHDAFTSRDEVRKFPVLLVKPQ